MVPYQKIPQNQLDHHNRPSTILSKTRLNLITKEHHVIILVEFNAQLQFIVATTVQFIIFRAAIRLVVKFFRVQQPLGP